MFPRVGWWVVGLVIGAVLAGSIPETLFPGARPAVFGAALLLIGLLGEVAGRSSIAAGPSPDVPRDLRQADGRVDLARVRGARRALGPSDARFGRFLGFDPNPPGEPLASGGVARDVPRGPTLLGRIVIVSLFVGRDGRSWSDEEIATAHAALLRAGAWIEREAIRYRAAVNIELANAYFTFDDDVPDDVAIGFAGEGDERGPLEEGATFKALVTATRAAVALGFRDVQDLFRAVADRVEADATVWLMHPRRAGRSLAVAPEDATLPGVCLAVCYPSEASFPEPLKGLARPDPVTLVHEFLHLFGATDKYGHPLRDYAPGSVSSQEVMRLSETRLGRLRIDRRTAEEIGWLSGPVAVEDRENATADANRSGRRRPRPRFRG